jgi:hypothetical protein
MAIIRTATDYSFEAEQASSNLVSLQKYMLRMAT